MKETGILFTPDNIRAIMEGRKTQTRRVIKPQPDPTNQRYDYNRVEQVGKWFHILADKPEPVMHTVICPQGIPGDRLYIKEGVITHISIPQLFGYYMDGCRATEYWQKRLTAMFMPKWAARTWLEITDIRVQRVQEISDEDCRAEGCKPSGFLPKNCPDLTCTLHHAEKAAFMKLWDSINGKKHPWSLNSWCWCITFKKI